MHEATIAAEVAKYTERARLQEESVDTERSRVRADIMRSEVVDQEKWKTV